MDPALVTQLPPPGQPSTATQSFILTPRSVETERMHDSPAADLTQGILVDGGVVLNTSHGNLHLDSRVGAKPVQMETTQVTIQEADVEELIPAAADTPMSPVPADPQPSAAPTPPPPPPVFA